jgi:hypothetical protein
LFIRILDRETSAGALGKIAPELVQCRQQLGAERRYAVGIALALGATFAR